MLAVQRTWHCPFFFLKMDGFRFYFWQSSHLGARTSEGGLAALLGAAGPRAVTALLLVPLLVGHVGRWTLPGFNNVRVTFNGSNVNSP